MLQKVCHRENFWQFIANQEETLKEQLYVRTHLVGRFGKPAPDIFIIFNTCTKLKKMGSRLVSIHYWVAQSFFQVEKK